MPIRMKKGAAGRGRPATVLAVATAVLSAGALPGAAVTDAAAQVVTTDSNRQTLDRSRRSLERSTDRTRRQLERSQRDIGDRAIRRNQTQRFEGRLQQERLRSPSIERPGR